MSGQEQDGATEELTVVKSHVEAADRPLARLLLLAGHGAESVSRTDGWTGCWRRRLSDKAGGWDEQTLAASWLIVRAAGCDRSAAVRMVAGSGGLWREFCRIGRRFGSG